MLCGLAFLKHIWSLPGHVSFLIYYLCAVLNQMLSELERHHSEIEMELSKLPEATRDQYLQLQSEVQELLEEVHTQEEYNKQLSEELSTAELELGKNPLKIRELNLQGQIKDLMGKKLNLQVTIRSVSHKCFSFPLKFYHQNKEEKPLHTNINQLCRWRWYPCLLQNPLFL